MSKEQSAQKLDEVAEENVISETCEELTDRELRKVAGGVQRFTGAAGPHTFTGAAGPHT